MHVADAWFLSRISDDADAAAAVGAKLPILGIGFALYSTIHQAGYSVTSQRITGTYGSLIIISLLAGLFMAIVFIFGADFFISLMGL